jgi:hypothetical protein
MKESAKRMIKKLNITLDYFDTLYYDYLKTYRSEVKKLQMIKNMPFLDDKKNISKRLEIIEDRIELIEEIGRQLKKES